MKKPIDIQLTGEGLDNLKREYKNLSDKRPVVLTRMVAAREQGDLSENAGYHAAKDELATTDRRLGELKMIFRYAEIVEAKQTDFVEIGSGVIVESGSAIQEFTIVGALEADPSKNKLSSLSPIGSAIIGKKVGDLMEIEVPNGKVTYKLLQIKS